MNSWRRTRSSSSTAKSGWMRRARARNRRRNSPPGRKYVGFRLFRRRALRLRGAAAAQGVPGAVDLPAEPFQLVVARADGGLVAALELLQRGGFGVVLVFESAQLAAQIEQQAAAREQSIAERGARSGPGPWSRRASCERPAHGIADDAGHGASTRAARARRSPIRRRNALQSRRDESVPAWRGAGAYVPRARADQKLKMPQTARRTKARRRSPQDMKRSAASRPPMTYSSTDAGTCPRNSCAISPTSPHSQQAASRAALPRASRPIHSRRCANPLPSSFL